MTRTVVRIIVKAGDPDRVRGRERFPAISVFRHSGTSAFRRFGVPVFRRFILSVLWHSGISAFRYSAFTPCPGHRGAVCAAGNAHERKTVSSDGRRTETAGEAFGIPVFQRSGIPLSLRARGTEAPYVPPAMPMREKPAAKTEEGGEGASPAVFPLSILSSSPPFFPAHSRSLPISPSLTLALTLSPNLPRSAPVRTPRQKQKGEKRKTNSETKNKS